LVSFPFPLPIASGTEIFILSGKEKAGTKLGLGSKELGMVYVFRSQPKTFLRICITPAPTTLLHFSKGMGMGNIWRVHTYIDM
jgi:hypothetical protein